MSQFPGNESSSGLGRLKRYGPLLVWMAFISIVSTSEFSAMNTSRAIRPLLLWLFPNLSDGQLAATHFLIRKLGHFTEYAVLGLLASRAFLTSSYEFIQQRWFQLGLLLIVFYALLDEFHQSLVPFRTASIYDTALDVIGGLSALVIVFFLRTRFQKNEGCETL